MKSCVNHADAIKWAFICRIATLREAFRSTPKWLGFNIELKYPTLIQLATINYRFYDRNYFVDSILKVLLHPAHLSWLWHQSLRFFSCLPSTEFQALNACCHSVANTIGALFYSDYSTDKQLHTDSPIPSVKGRVAMYVLHMCCKEGDSKQQCPSLVLLW